MTDRSGPTPGQPPLPVLALASDSYRAVLGDLDRLLRTAAVWWLLLTGLTLLLGLLVGSVDPTTEAATGAGVGLLYAALAFVSIAVSVAVPVAWHRQILVGEETVWMAPLTPRVAAYLLWSIIVGLVAALPVGLALLLLGLARGGGTAAGPDAAVVVVMVAGVLAAIYLSVRLSLVLPAKAIGEPRIGPAAAWQATRGNGVRLVLLLALAVVPVQLGTALLVFLARALPLPALVPTAIDAAGMLLAGALFATALSYAYRHLVRDPLTPARASP